MIPESTREIIHRLSELGYLYERVAAFVQAGEANPSVGLIKQSLCHHLQAQLTEYYRIVAVLESQITQAGSDDGTTSLEDTGLTLRRLEVWIEEWRLRMRMMSVCVEGCKGVLECLCYPHAWDLHDERRRCRRRTRQSDPHIHGQWGSVCQAIYRRASRRGGLL